MRRSRNAAYDDLGLFLGASLLGLWVWRHYSQLFIYSGLISLLVVVLVAAHLAITKRHKPANSEPKAMTNKSGRDFEDQIVIWLKSCGYKEVFKTEYYDYGIDIVAAKPGVILGVQVKHSSKAVGVAGVRAAISGLKHYGCTQAMVVTDSTFTKAAISLAEENDCKLVDGAILHSGNFQLS